MIDVVSFGQGRVGLYDRCMEGPARPTCVWLLQARAGFEPTVMAALMCGCTVLPSVLPDRCKPGLLSQCLQTLIGHFGRFLCNPPGGYNVWG